MLYEQLLQRAWVDSAAPQAGYPYDLAAVRALRHQPLAFHAQVTYLVGENGTGKSTLLEAMAVALGFNPEGGTRHLRFATRDTHSSLVDHIRLSKGRRARRGYFVRAESFYNLASAVDQVQVSDFYGGTSLHDMSHGEAFLALAANHFRNDGLFLLDEPEAGLSPARQLSVLSLIHDAVQQGSQFVIATHSPFIMAYPQAWVYWLDSAGVRRLSYDDTEHVQITRDFLASPNRMLRHLFDGDADP
jgi:predicted ATPase